MLKYITKLDLYCYTCWWQVQSCPRNGGRWRMVGRKEMFYLTTHSTHFIYSYMASDIWLRTILIVRKETRCRHIGYSFQLTARVLLYAPSHSRIAHTMAFVTPVVEHWLDREIAQWVHPIKDRSDYQSHHERTLLPRSYISLGGCGGGVVKELYLVSDMVKV